MSVRRKTKTSFHTSYLGADPEKPVIVLATTVVSVLDYDGNKGQYRALLDSGSEASIVSERFMRHGNFQREYDGTMVAGVGDVNVELCRGRIKFQLLIDDGKNYIDMEALILKKVTGVLPSTEIDITDFTEYRNLKLADPSFHIPAHVDMILGADVFYIITQPGYKTRVNGFPMMQTRVGNVIGGRIERIGVNYPSVVKM
jgi:hypothetical protein